MQTWSVPTRRWTVSWHHCWTTARRFPLRTRTRPPRQKLGRRLGPRIGESVWLLQCGRMAKRSLYSYCRACCDCLASNCRKLSSDGVSSDGPDSNPSLPPPLPRLRLRLRPQPDLSRANRIDQRASVSRRLGWILAGAWAGATGAVNDHGGRHAIRISRRQVWTDLVMLFGGLFLWQFVGGVLSSVLRHPVHTNTQLAVQSLRSGWPWLGYERGWAKWRRTGIFNGGGRAGCFDRGRRAVS